MAGTGTGGGRGVIPGRVEQGASISVSRRLAALCSTLTNSAAKQASGRHSAGTDASQTAHNSRALGLVPAHCRVTYDQGFRSPSSQPYPCTMPPHPPPPLSPARTGRLLCASSRPLSRRAAACGAAGAPLERPRCRRFHPLSHPSMMPGAALSMAHVHTPSRRAGGGRGRWRWWWSWCMGRRHDARSRGAPCVSKHGRQGARAAAAPAAVGVQVHARGCDSDLVAGTREVSHEQSSGAACGRGPRDMQTCWATGQGAGS